MAFWKSNPRAVHEQPLEALKKAHTVAEELVLVLLAYDNQSTFSV